LFSERLQTCEVKEGEPVRFKVRVSGKPAPVVTWYRDGVQIVCSPDFNITQVSGVGSGEWGQVSEVMVRCVG